MTTKIRMTKNNDLTLYIPSVKSIRETGGHTLGYWSVTSTGTSSDSESEIDAPNNTWDGSLPEITSITCNTKTNSIGSNYVTVYADDNDGTETQHYYYIDKQEITEVTCLSKANCTDGSTFHFYVDDGAGGETHYYCWIDKTGSTGDPGETGTGIECDISGDTTATNVASTVATAITAKSNVSASNTNEVVTITNGNNGDVTDAGNGEGTATGFSFSIEQGGDDPSATGTGHSVDISGDTSASDVASTLATAINGSTNLTSSSSSDVVTVETDNASLDVTDATDSGSAVSSISITREGAASYAGGYLYIKSASANDTDSSSGHVRKVTVIGFDTKGDPQNDVISLNGTSYVKSGVKFKRISHMYASNFGSGGSDAADAITLETTGTGNGTTLLTIAQAKTESNGARIYVPSGNYAHLESIGLMNITNANNGTTIVRVYCSGFEDSLNTDSDFDNKTVIASQYNTALKETPVLSRRVGTNTAHATFKEREMGTQGNEDYVFSIHIITYQK